MSMPSSQGTKLDQYRIAAKGQMRVGHKAAGWAGFATAAGATLAMSGVAEATIIYSGTAQNISVSLADPPGAWSLQSASLNAIDIDNDGQNDVNFTVQNKVATGAPRDDVFLLGNGGFFSGLGSTTRAAFSATAATSTANAQQLSAGQSIGPSGIFGGSSSAIAQGTLTFAAVTGGVATTASATTKTGLWTQNVNGFLGVQFQHANATHYGWIRLNFEDTDNDGQLDRITAIDWAYQATEGFGIRAGQTVPEPTPLALLAAGAVGIAGFRRKRKAATAA